VSDLVFRVAEPADLEAIVRLHESDTLGGHEDAWTQENRVAYEAAFARIRESAAHTLYVAVDEGGIVGTFQLTVTPGLTGRGRTRAILESVQVRSDRRSRGIGARLVAFAESEAKANGAESLHLVSNKSRTDAHRFYERLGYARSHEGFKKRLA
jgi:GNAT superfamily N-acetyltransferase